MSRFKQCWKTLLTTFQLTTRQHWLNFFISFFIIVSHILILAKDGVDYKIFIFTALIPLCNLPLIPFTYYIIENQAKKIPKTTPCKRTFFQNHYAHTCKLLQLFLPQFSSFLYLSGITLGLKTKNRELYIKAL